MSTKPPKQSKKETAKNEALATSSDLNMSALANLLDQHRASLSAEFKAAISTLEVKLDQVQTKVLEHDQKLNCIDTAMNDFNERIQALESTCATLADSNAKLKAKAADLESRSRRNNIRIIGLPESIEGGHPTTFFSELLHSILGGEVLPSLPELDRAHRSLAPKPKTGEKPRPVIIRFHKYKVKEKVVLEARRRRGELLYNGRPVTIYEDYSPEVMEQRSLYRGVMAKLYKQGFRPSLLFPAKLRITAKDGKKVFLESVERAEAFIAAHHGSSSSPDLG